MFVRFRCFCQECNLKVTYLVSQNKSLLGGVFGGEGCFDANMVRALWLIYWDLGVLGSTVFFSDVTVYCDTVVLVTE